MQTLAPLRFEFVPAQKQSTLGGLPAREALAQRFDLWVKLRTLPGLDPWVRTTQGYNPELIVGQWLYALGSGGGGLADAERLNDEPLAHPLARVEHFADQTQLGEWLRKQTDASIAAVWGFIREFVPWVIGPGAPRFKPISCRTSFPPPSVPHPAYFNQNATPTG